MSVGKTADDGNVSVFTKEDIRIYTGEGILITHKGTPILIGGWDERGRYRVPPVQQKEEWKPKMSTKALKQYLQ